MYVVTNQLKTNPFTEFESRLRNYEEFNITKTMFSQKKMF